LSLLDELGLTYPQYLAMVLLWEQNELDGRQPWRSGTISPEVKRGPLSRDWRPAPLTARAAPAAGFGRGEALREQRRSSTAKSQVT